MSDNVEDLIGKLKGLPEFIEQSGEQSIIESEGEITDLNKGQLLSGVDANDNPLGDYTALSKMLRTEKGLQVDHIDLRDTGDFQKSIKLVQNKGTFEIDATDEKWESKLQPRWPSALGLTETSENTITEVLGESVGKQVDSYL